MSPQPNPSLSVDCVVFGFDGAALKVLLVERDFVNPAGEREKHVAHKPAMFYSFDKGRFQKDVRQKFRLNFINWQL